MDFKYFNRDEFACTCGCGTNYIQDGFIFTLDKLREACGFPFQITSGYRCPDHPEEAKKEAPGQHNAGLAADIKVKSGSEKYKIIKHATRLGFAGIGVANTFIHVDRRTSTPVVWTY